MHATFHARLYGTQGLKVCLQYKYRSLNEHGSTLKIHCYRRADRARLAWPAVLGKARRTNQVK